MKKQELEVKRTEHERERETREDTVRDSDTNATNSHRYQRKRIRQGITQARDHNNKEVFTPM